MTCWRRKFYEKWLCLNPVHDFLIGKDKLIWFDKPYAFTFGHDDDISVEMLENHAPFFIYFW